MNELITLDQKAEEIATKVKELEEAILEIQMPRSPYVLKHFVVGQHDTEPQAYAQALLELSIKQTNIQRAILNKKKIQLKIEELEKKGTELDAIEADLMRIDMKEQDLACLGAVREFEALYKIWKGFGKNYTREELDAAQEEYWIKRLTRQAQQDLLAYGRVGVGNQEALKQIGRAAAPQLDHIRDVERKYLSVGDTKILIVVPTEKKAENGLPCLDGLLYPSGCQIKLLNTWGRAVADAYNYAAQQACDDGADFMFTVEDDTFPPPDTLIKLLNFYRKSEGKTIVGAWYPKRNLAREGAPIVIRDGKRQPLPADGQIHEVYTITMGATLIPVQAFFATQYPWFVTTEHLTQDSFFSCKAIEAGFKLLVDTSIKCKHVDRVTGEVFE